MKRALLFPLLLGAACAEEAPGFPPPPGQLYFPIGLTVATPSPGLDVLIVSSSDFDQRFNAGFVTTLEIADLFTLAEGGTGATPKYVPSFAEGNADAFLGQVRVPMLGGEILHVPSPAPGVPARLFVPSRGKNLLTMLALGSDGKPTCSNTGPSGETITAEVATDCSPAHIVQTRFDDPFSLAYIPSTGARGQVAVGHLSTVRDENQRPLSGVSLVDVERFESRIASEASGNVPPGPGDPSYPLETFQFGDFGGNSGLAVSPGSALGVNEPLFGASKDLNPGLPLTVFAPVSEGGRFVLRRVGALDLSGAASAIEMRGLALAGDRAYLTIRFAEAETAYNAGVAVVAVTASGLSLLSVLELGDEISKPTLLQRGASRLLYVPDIRDDRIWVVDVSSDEPLLAASIDGRANRVIDGVSVQASTLSSPSEIVFATLNGKTYGFVSNFGNSTLAVIDATDIDPRRHKLIARLGRDLDANGETEMAP